MSTSSASTPAAIEQEMAQLVVLIGQNLTNTYVNSERAGVINFLNENEH